MLPRVIQISTRLAATFVWFCKEWKLWRQVSFLQIPQLPDFLGNIYLLHWAESFWELRGSQLVKKFPEFYGTQRFITAFTRTRHLSLSWASSIQSVPLSNPNPGDPYEYYPPIYTWVFQVASGIFRARILVAARIIR